MSLDSNIPPPVDHVNLVFPLSTWSSTVQNRTWYPKWRNVEARGRRPNPSEQLSLQMHNAWVRTSHASCICPQGPGCQGILSVSSLVSSLSWRYFPLPEVPCILVTTLAVPVALATLTFPPRCPEYPYQHVCIGWLPRRSPSSRGLDPAACNRLQGGGGNR